MELGVAALKAREQHLRLMAQLDADAHRRQLGLILANRIAALQP
jgi:hypothetical protein